jgi:hypothetical protein
VLMKSDPAAGYPSPALESAVLLMLGQHMAENPQQYARQQSGALSGAALEGRPSSPPPPLPPHS